MSILAPVPLRAVPTLRRRRVFGRFPWITELDRYSLELLNLAKYLNNAIESVQQTGIGQPGVVESVVINDNLNLVELS